VISALVFAACSADGGEAAPPSESLDCEVLGFPCSWDEVSDDLRERTAELLLRAGQALDRGEDPTEVADELRGEPGVASVIASRTGVQIRVEGAPPVVAFETFTHPVASAIRAVAEDPGSARRGTPPTVAQTMQGASGAGPILAATNWLPPVAMNAHAPVERVLAEAVPFAASADAGPSSYEPARDPDLRPRSALIIRPWDGIDAEGMFLSLQGAGRLPAGVNSPDDLDLNLVGLGTAASVLTESPYISAIRAQTDDAFSEFGNHDLVYLQTHGSAFRAEDGCHPDQGHICGSVVGGFPLQPVEVNTVSPLQDQMFLPDVSLPPGATIGHVMGWWTVGYTPDFFRQVYGGGRLDGIVVMNSCNSAADDGVFEGLATTASATGGPGVFGWTDYIDAITADRSAAVLFDLLVNKALTTHTAIGAIGAVREFREHVTAEGDSPRLVFAGRDLRARDAVEIHDDGFPMEPDAVLQVVGTPDDGEDDHIQTLTFRIDGVVPGEQDDAILTWQLVGRHDAPIRIDRPFESREGLEVTEIEPELPFASYGQLDPSRWSAYLVTLTDLELGFDVTRDEVVRFRQQQLRVELSIEGGSDPSRHEVIPVYLRQGFVEVVDPELGQPLQAEQRISIDGSSGDAVPEEFPLVVNLDNLDDSLVADLMLEIRLGDVDVTIPGTQWERIEDGRYQVVRSVELFDFDEDEVSLTIEAVVELPEIGSIEFVADPVIVELARVGCDYLDGFQMSQAMGRAFSEPEDLGEFGPMFQGMCRWSAERSTVEISLVGARAVEQLRTGVESGEVAGIDGFGDAAAYDLVSGNALNPSGIQEDGEMQYTNFVNLFVVIDDSTYATIHVAGNIVIEEGPESGLLTRLQRLVDALRQ
jgi:hypothetical protein